MIVTIIETKARSSFQARPGFGFFEVCFFRPSEYETVENS